MYVREYTVIILPNFSTFIIIIVYYNANCNNMK